MIDDQEKQELSLPSALHLASTLLHNRLLPIFLRISPTSSFLTHSYKEMYRKQMYSIIKSFSMHMPANKVRY